MASSRAPTSTELFAGFHPDTRRRIEESPSAIRLAWTAGALFSEQGYGATSIRDIAAAAGVAPSSVYSHYPSKEALLVAYLNESHELVASVLRSQVLENAGRPPGEQVAALIRFTTERALAHPGSWVLSRPELRRAGPESTELARRMRRDAAGFLGDIVRRGRAAGVFRSSEPGNELGAALLSTVRQAGPWLHRWPVAPAPDVVHAFGGFARRIVMGSARVEPVPLPRPARPPGSSTRDRILRAAAEHIARSGYASASMRDIGQTVGIRPPSIYEHFASKEQLFAAVVELVVRGRVEVAERALARPPSPRVVDRVVDLLRDIVGGLVVAPEEATAADADFDHLPEAIAESLATDHRHLVAVLASLVREGRSAGEFDYREPTALVVFGVLAVAMQAAWMLLENPQLDPPTLVADSVSYALRILGVDR